MTVRMSWTKTITTDIPQWMGQSPRGPTLLKVLQPIKVSFQWQRVFPKENHTNWLSRIKWPDLKTYRAAGWWWHTHLIPALWRQKQVDLWVQGQQDYPVRPCTPLLKCSGLTRQQINAKAVLIISSSQIRYSEKSNDLVESLGYLIPENQLWLP